MTITFRLQPVRMVEIKNTNNSIWWKLCGTRGIFSQFWYECKFLYSLWKSIMSVSQKIESQSSSRLSYTPLRHMPKRCSVISQRYLLNCKNVIHNGEEPGYNLDAPQPKNGKRKCGTFTEWNITQLLKTTTSGNLKAN